MLWAFVPYMLWLLLFLKVPLPSSITTGQANEYIGEATSGIFGAIISSALLRTSVIGITLLALLSGSGAMAAAWDAYDDLMLLRASSSSSRSWRSGADGRPAPRSGALLVTPQDVQNAQASFERTLADLQEKRATIERLQAEVDSGARPLSSSHPNGGASGSSGGGFLGRLNPFAGGDARVKEIKTLKYEVWALENLGKNMRADLEAMQSRARRLSWSKTLTGRLLILVGWGFALYCVMRLFLAALSLLVLGYRDSAPPDFVSYGLASLLRLFSLDAELDVAAWTRQISLLLIGVLIAMRMRAVLQYLSSAFKAASSGTSSTFLVLFMAEVAVMYLLATLIQLRTALPPVGSGGAGSGTGSQAEPVAPITSPHPGLATGIDLGNATHIASQVAAATGALLSRALESPSSGTAGAAPTPTPTPTTPLPLLASLPSFQVVFGALFDSAFLLSAAATGVVKWLAHKNDLDAGGTLLGARD